MNGMCYEAFVKNQVTIPALPICNLAAVGNMVRKCGGEAIITDNPKDLYSAQKIIIAGVGAFDAGMEALNAGGWLNPLNDIAERWPIPILGICLGMQLMCRRSDEGVLPGLGWFNADVKRFIPPEGSGLKVPHMGWNTLNIRNANALLSPTADEQRFYFVHSYHVLCDDAVDVVATTTHGLDLTAAIGRDHLYGTQFHPEKSHRFGMALIQNFLEL
jgi:imidazole glycerol-phosphate synthase subunit HisH